MLKELHTLRSGVASGQIDVEQAAGAFERLTLLLSNVTPPDERVLVALVNDIERIRFTRMPENQPGAVHDVLVQAEEVFERYL